MLRLLPLFFALAACAIPADEDLRQILLTHDLELRGGDATLQLFDTGRGSITTADQPDLPVPFDWTLRGRTFCVELARTTGWCATVEAQGNTLVFSGRRDGTTSTARLIPR